MAEMVKPTCQRGVSPHSSPLLFTPEPAGEKTNRNRAFEYFRTTYN